MKRIIILAVMLLVAASCSVTRDRVTLVYYADYTKHPDMWISPNPCPLDHEVLGQLSIEIHPGIISNPPQKQEPRDAVYGMGNPSYQRVTSEEIGYDELLDIAVTEAKKRGANGISNLKIDKVSVPNSLDYNYEIYGLLVKVK